MKTPGIPEFRYVPLPASLRAVAILLTFILPHLRGATTAPEAADYDYAIHVRSAVDQKYTTFGKEPPKDHGKRFAIIEFKQFGAPLAKPVNEPRLFQQLGKTLSAYGYHQPEAGVNPDIVLTVRFGRSRLSNPYVVRGEGILVFWVSAV